MENRVASRWLRAQWIRVRGFFKVGKPLFHATTGPRAGAIIRSGGILSDSGFSNFGGQVGISATRDLSLALKGNFGPYIFVIDGSKVRQTHRVSPVQHPSASDEMEERIWAEKIPISMMVGLLVDRNILRFEADSLASSLPFPVVYRDREGQWVQA